MFPTNLILFSISFFYNLIGVPIAAAAYRILQAELRGKTPLNSKQ